jgi:hypothetical protein
MAAITTCLLCGTTLTDMEAALADLKVLHVAARAMFRDLHKLMRKRSPAWMYCASDSGSLHVSPRLRPLYLRAVDVLGADDHHKCAECLFEAIVDLIGISDLADMMHERVGRA